MRLLQGVEVGAEGVSKVEAEEGEDFWVVREAVVQVRPIRRYLVV